MSNRDQAPEKELPRDPFTAFRRNWADHPAVLKAVATIMIPDDYGNLETWVLETYRAEGSEVVFLQRVNQEGAVRLVLPQQVTRALARQRDSVEGQARRRGARQAVETKRAKGQAVGNPAALKAARRGRK